MILWGNVVVALVFGIIFYGALILATNYVVLFGAPSARERHEILMKARGKVDDAN